MMPRVLEVRHRGQHPPSPESEHRDGDGHEQDRAHEPRIERRPSRLHFARTSGGQLRLEPVDLGGQLDPLLAPERELGLELVLHVRQAALRSPNLAETLQMTGRWPLPDDVSGLALSEDGARLYAALGGRVTVVDTHTGDATTTLAFGGIESILHVTTP